MSVAVTLVVGLAAFVVGVAMGMGGGKELISLATGNGLCRVAA